MSAGLNRDVVVETHTPAEELVTARPSKKQATSDISATLTLQTLSAVTVAQMSIMSKTIPEVKLDITLIIRPPSMSLKKGSASETADIASLISAVGSFKAMLIPEVNAVTTSCRRCAIMERMWPASACCTNFSAAALSLLSVVVMLQGTFDAISRTRFARISHFRFLSYHNLTAYHW